MYEVEYKVEITEEEKDRLIALLKSRNFTDKGKVLQKDYYVEVKSSSIKGYDFNRYRDEGGKIFYTEKIWEENEEVPVHKEMEREVSREEFAKELDRYPNALKITKERQIFAGILEGQDFKIDMDSVKFDHSPNMRYFIEVEIMTEKKEEVSRLRNLIRSFLQKLLEKEEIIESPGMLDMVFNKK